MTIRSRVRDLRYRAKDDAGNKRLRHSTYFIAWVQRQANRLGVTTAAIIERLRGGDTFETIEGTATPPPVVIPANTVLPAITGTAQVGQVLTVTNGTWTGTSPTFARQWKAAGVNIANATGTTYTPVVGDVGKAITCTVTATNTAGSASATSAATAAVIAA